MPVTLLQIPVGPEVFVILLVTLSLFVILLGVAVVVLVGVRRRQSGDETESSERIEALERRVDELEKE
jgi:type II secretory pathway component PulJ